MDLVGKCKYIPSPHVVMQQKNKEADVLCPGARIFNRFGRWEAATESSLLIISGKRRHQLDSHTAAEVCGAGS